MDIKYYWAFSVVVAIGGHKIGSWSLGLKTSVRFIASLSTHGLFQKHKATKSFKFLTKFCPTRWILFESNQLIAAMECAGTSRRRSKLSFFVCMKIHKIWELFEVCSWNGRQVGVLIIPGSDIFKERSNIACDERQVLITNVQRTDVVVRFVFPIRPVNTFQELRITNDRHLRTTWVNELNSSHIKCTIEVNSSLSCWHNKNRQQNQTWFTHFSVNKNL